MKKFTIYMMMFLAGVVAVSILPGYAQQQMPATQQNALSGKILETMNSGGYTYVLLEKDGLKIWAATREISVAVGQEISLSPGPEMVAFKSSTLNRTFDKIIFSAGLVSDNILAPSHAATKASPAMGMGRRGATAPISGTIKVEKASGSNAYTVAELYEKGSALDKQSIVVRGQVVKVSPEIMGKNWVHLQDGTGDKGKKTHDLVVTTQDKPAVGDVVTAHGILYKDKDFGSGYKYNVIVEEATTKQ
jgi:hypothetical protein